MSFVLQLIIAGAVMLGSVVIAHIAKIGARQFLTSNPPDLATVIITVPESHIS